MIALVALGGTGACSDDAPGTGDETSTSSGTDDTSATATSPTGSTTSPSSTSPSSTSPSSTDGSSTGDGSTSDDTGSTGVGSDSSGDSTGSGSTAADGGSSSSSDDTGTADCDCAANQYCDWPDDACGDGAAGTCMPRPIACDDIYDPVCGCDGRTHSNDCDAAAAGVDVDYAGECEAAAACDCNAGEYCVLPIGMCDSEAGVCEDIPNVACAEIYDPVCGCDGQTYSNACEAGNAGMNIDYDGEC